VIYQLEATLYLPQKFLYAGTRFAIEDSLSLFVSVGRAFCSVKILYYQTFAIWNFATLESQPAIGSRQVANVVRAAQFLHYINVSYIVDHLFFSYYQMEKLPYSESDCDAGFACKAFGGTKTHSALLARHLWHGIFPGPPHLSFCFLQRRHATTDLKE
jgi:hypothetical protein